MATYEETVQSILDSASAAAATATAEDLVLLAKAAQAVDIGSGVVVSGLTIITTAREGALTDITTAKDGSVTDITTARDNALASVDTAVNDALTSNVKTINGESIVGTGDLVIDAGSSFPKKRAEGLINLAQHFTSHNINWAGTNTNSYAWLIQRTDDVASGVAQFALIQGGAKFTGDATSGGTILPFQVNADDTITIGTPTKMFTSSSVSGFSTCSLITDNKSGAFHYSGNIPWTGCTSHVMGHGRGRLSANNTADSFWDSGTGTSEGIHDHNGQYFGVPDADGSGFRGVNAGYASVDSKTRIHFCDFSNPDSPTITVQNPSANTSTSPIMQLIRRAGSNSSSTAICGVSHWRDSSNYVNARVFAANSNSYTDYNSNKDWGEYRSGQFYGIELSNGKTLVYHGGKTFLYTAYNNRTDVTSTAGAAVPFDSNADWMGACIIPDGTDSWLMLNSSSSNTTTIQKWSINPTTYKWTKIFETAPYVFTGQSFMKLNELPNNRLMLSIRRNYGIFEYMIVDRPTQGM